MDSGVSLAIAIGTVTALWFVTSRLRRGVSQRAPRSPARPPGIHAVDAVWYLHVGDEAAVALRAAIARLAPHGTLAPGAVREVALAMARALDLATHAFVGEAGDSAPFATVQVSSDAVLDGVTVGLRVQSRYGVALPDDARDRAAIDASLRALADTPVVELIDAHFAAVERVTSGGAVTLHALREGSTGPRTE